MHGRGYPRRSTPTDHGWRRYSPSYPGTPSDTDLGYMIRTAAEQISGLNRACLNFPLAPASPNQPPLALSMKAEFTLNPVYVGSAR